MTTQNQFIDVMTGRIVTAAYVDEKRFYVDRELRKDGKPDGRAKGEFKQITQSPHGYFIGRFAPLDPAREKVLDPIRKRIESLREQASTLERHLKLLYCPEATVGAGQEYDGYVTYVSTEASYYGSECTPVLAFEIASRLADLIRDRFPGIEVRFIPDSGGSGGTVGTEEGVITMIDNWIAENWQAAL